MILLAWLPTKLIVSAYLVVWYSKRQHGSTAEGTMGQAVSKRKTDARAATFRLSSEARALLAELARRRGIDKTAALEVLIREAAERAGVKSE